MTHYIAKKYFIVCYKVGYQQLVRLFLGGVELFDKSRGGDETRHKYLTHSEWLLKLDLVTHFISNNKVILCYIVCHSVCVVG